MRSKNPTLAIYGNQDITDNMYPQYVHDHNVTIMQDGKIISFLQQERITRKKRDNTLYADLKSLLKQKKIINHPFSVVFVDNVIGRSFISKDGSIRFEGPINQPLFEDLEKGRCWWLDRKKDAYVLNHELAHIFTCLPFFGMFKENSLLVHFDGGASQSNFSVFTYKNSQLKIYEYHWKLKDYSSIFNANALVFSIIGAKKADQNAVPGKFMGFAGLGNYNPKIEKWLLEHHFFQDIWSNKSSFFKEVQLTFGIDLKSFNQKSDFLQDLAATLQEIFTKRLLKELENLANATKTDYLYYTGGSALNIVANSRIIESNIFKDVFIPPCTEDSGLSLGAAAFMEWKKGNTIKRDTPYLNNWEIEDYKVCYTDDEINRIAKIISEGKVIGIINGYGEAGPRALGNRSIIALANSKKLAYKISVEQKQREWYRPLAPIALEKNVKYLTGKNNIHHLSKYMLLDFKVAQEYKDEIEGVVHRNGSTRFQTIFNREQNPFIFDLLTVLDEEYQIKALINTSFNGKGEPIVHTIDDALRTYEKLGLDHLVINGKLYTKK